MKKIILSGIFMLLMVSVFAQKNNAEERPAVTATKVLVEKYNLNKAQKAKVLKIQENKMKNRAAIAELENTDIEKYIQKWSNNERQSRFSVQMILDTEQRKILYEEEVELRKKRAAIASKMQKDGAALIDIKKALLDYQ